MDHKPIDVAVFWDLGSCPVSNGTDASGFDIVGRIRTLALRFGVIKSFKGYMPNTDLKPMLSNWGASKLRSQLQSSGVSLTDVPGRREVSDKMVIVDMLGYAFDRSPNETVLILITAEPSFAYALAFLRMRNYRVVLLAPDSETTLGLISQAHSCFNWVDQAQPAEPVGGLQAHGTPVQSSPGVPGVRSTSLQGDHPSPARRQQSYADSAPVDAAQALDTEGTEEEPPQQQRLGPIHQGPTSSHNPLEDAFHSHPEAFLTGTLPPGSTFLGLPGQEEDPMARDKTHVTSTRPWPGDNVSVDAGSSPAPITSFEGNPSGLSPLGQKMASDTSIPRPYSIQPSQCTSRAATHAHTVEQSPPWYGLNVNSNLPPSPLDEGGQHSGTAGGAGTIPPSEPSTSIEVPAYLFTLIDVLRCFKKNGVLRPLRTTVALEIVRRDRFVYKNAGCATFAQFTSMAEALGFITLGGWTGTAWIALKDPHI